ncbi:unnamed protein product [Diamesa tonsa]
MDILNSEREKSKTKNEYLIGFIGCGNMAISIAMGLMNKNLIDPCEIIISGTSSNSFKKWEKFKVTTTLNNVEVVKKSKIIFLCVKPNALAIVSGQFYGFSSLNYPEKSFVSILAGIELSKIISSFHELEKAKMSFVRAMPNTPLQIGAGATALTKIDPISEESLKNLEIIKTLFGALGIVDIVEESKFHAITGLSGSGPAYIYTIIDALSDAGVKQGLPRELATRFAAQTVFGSSKNVLESGLHPAVLKEQVTSPGGTTIYGVHELERGRIRDTLINAVEAATNRSKELANM